VSGGTSGATGGIGLRSSRGPILLAVMLSTALIAVDATVISTAVTSVVEELGGFESFPWLFSIYLLSITVLVPVYSKLGDMLGRKPVILFGIAVFLLGSILCGAAWDMTSLIVFRALQGIGAGAISPMSMTILGDIYDLKERARVQGYIGAVWGTASVVGPALGAVFAMAHAWRFIFFINIPLCLIAMWLVWRGLREDVPRRRHRIDYPGAVLITLGLGAIILGVLEGGRAWTWDSAVSVGLFVGGALLLVAFGLVERRAAEPVLPLSILRRPVMAVSVGLGIALGIAMIGLAEYVPTYLQIGAGVSPFIAGLALSAQLIGWPTAATLAGRIYLKRGFRFTLLLGATLAAVGGLGLALVSPYPSPWLVGACALVMGFGFGWAALPVLVSAQSRVSWEERGVVTGTILFSRSLGQAIGAAVLGAIANAVIADRGGDENVPETMIAAGIAVFTALAITLGAKFVLAWFMPKDPPHGVKAVDPATGDPTSEIAVVETIVGVDVEDPAQTGSIRTRPES